MDVERWNKFPRSAQLGAIASEIARATHWEEKDEEKFLSAIERAMHLLELTLDDKRPQGNTAMLLYLREELAKFYTKQKKGAEKLYAAM